MMYKSNSLTALKKSGKQGSIAHTRTRITCSIVDSRTQSTIRSEWNLSVFASGVCPGSRCGLRCGSAQGCVMLYFCFLGFGFVVLSFGIIFDIDCPSSVKDTWPHTNGYV